MSDFEIRPKGEMPTNQPFYRKTGMTEAIRRLNGTEAIFVSPRDGESLKNCANRHYATASRLAAHVRLDRERNGVWIYKDEVRA